MRFSPDPRYAFRHPLIRAVANESQLKSDRAQLHRRLAAMIEGRNPDSADANAAMIAEHLEAAGDLKGAYDWHMRAASWVNYRDNTAAARSWHRAQQVADRLPNDHPDRMAMRIEPRTILCATGFRVSGSGFSAVIDRLATVKTDPELVLYEIWPLRMRALLARAVDDEAGYRDYRDRYRKMARELGFEDHIELAEAMP